MEFGHDLLLINSVLLATGVVVALGIVRHGIVLGFLWIFFGVVEGFGGILDLELARLSYKVDV